MILSRSVRRGFTLLMVILIVFSMVFGEISAVVVRAAEETGLTERENTVNNVTEMALSTKYDFKAGINSTIEDNGWKVEKCSSGYRNKPYGIQVLSNKDDYIKFAIMVPENGYYTVKFTGAGAGGGAIADLMVDNTFVGQIDFYSAQYVPAQPPLMLKTLYLDAGIHYFTVKAVDKSDSWGYNMYPGELEIIKKEGLAVLEAVYASASKADIAVGQTSVIKAIGKMNDGYLDQLRGSDAVKEYYSSKPSIAAIDENGIIRAVSPGTADITVRVTMNEVSQDTKVPITVNDKYLDSVELTLEKYEIFEGLSIPSYLKAKLNDGSEIFLGDAVVKYSSEDDAVATINESGIINAIALGTTNIKAEVSLGNHSVIEQVQINVIGLQLESVNVTADKTSFFPEEIGNLSVTGTMNNGAAADMTKADSIIYDSSNKDIVDVDGAGKITAKKTGEADITVSATIYGVTKTSEPIKIFVRPIESKKTRSTIYTPEKVAAARSNIEKYDWAKAKGDAAIQKADSYLAEGHDFLWSVITPQSIIRGYAVNQSKGCLNCGKEIDKFGNYPYLADPVKNPWKLECPNCHYKFPTNDFESYYKSGLNDRGLFDPSLADKSLLVNTSYPEKGEKWGVDDGWGYKDPSGNIYTFIPYYAHWIVWDGIDTAVYHQAIRNLRDAYLYTGDSKYAAAGIILLDRVADVYPEMSVEGADLPKKGILNSHGGTNKGKVVGSIWEVSLAEDTLRAYDAFFPAFDDPQVQSEVLEFFRRKLEQYNLGPLKKSMTGIKLNIEENIVKQIYPSVKSANIRGNTGSHQGVLAIAAVIYDTLPETKEWLDFIFQPGSLVLDPVTKSYKVTGGNILSDLVDSVDRDGQGTEVAPNYNAIWINSYYKVADILQGYDKYSEADLFQNVKFRAMLYAQFPALLSNKYTANEGDAAFTGNPSTVMRTFVYLRAFEVYKDPIFAQLAYLLNGNSIKNLAGGNIFNLDPEKQEKEVMEIINTKGPLNLKSTNQAGYGLAALRDGIAPNLDIGTDYNFMSMTPVESTKEWEVLANSAFQFNAEGVEDSISFDFNIAAADNYEIDLVPNRNTANGIYEVTIDESVISTIDMSGSTTLPVTLGAINLSEGSHRITFRCTGKSSKSSGYKFSAFRFNLYNQSEQDQMEKSESTQRDTYLYYGRTTGHGHQDSLNIGLHAFGLDVAPDLGYPNVADGVSPHRHEWVRHTISHNTVLVDKKPQAGQISATPKHFDDEERVKLIDVESPFSYPDIELYKRTTAMIRVDDKNSYTIDFFRVKGGNDHHFSFHGAEGTVTTEGLNLVKQADSSGNYIGSYAGIDIPYGQREPDKGSGWTYAGSGFHFLENIDKDSNPGQQFSIDWNIVDTWKVLRKPEDIHLRLTMLGDFSDISLADGIPPTNKPGNPESLRYLIAHRSGENLDSLFTSVIEPYKEERYIESISPVSIKVDGKEIENSSVKAVKVVLKNGRIDYIISALNSDIVYTVDDQFQFRGFFGVIGIDNEKPGYFYINDGSTLGTEISDVKSNVSGTVVDFTKDMNLNNEITLHIDDRNFKVEDLVGRFIYIDNDGTQNAAYKILGIKAQNGNEVTVDIGATTLIRKYIDSSDLSKGYVFNIAEGNTFRIPLSHKVTFESTEPGGDTGNGGVTPPPVDVVKEDGTIIIDKGNIAIKEGQASVSIKQDTLTKAVDNAVKSGQTEPIIQVPEIEGVKKVNVEIPAAALNYSREKGMERIGIETSIAGISITPDALKNSVTKDAVKIEISIAEGDKKDLSPETIQKVGNSSVYDFNIYADGEKITNFTGKKAIEVTIPYNLTQGEDVSKIVAYYINDKGELKVVKHCVYDETTKTVVFRTNHLGNYLVKESTVAFGDVKENSWSKSYIYALAAREIIKGRSVDEFAPEENITRAEFLRLVMETLDLSDEQAESNFSDVEKGAWYYKAVASAEKLGIVSGIGDNKFGIDNLITRQEMAAMAYNAVKAAEIQLNEVKDPAVFNDNDSIDDYAIEGITAMQKAGILDGMNNNQFVPQGNATREQAAKMIYLLFKLI